MYEDNPSEFVNLLEEKAKETTVVELTGFAAIKEWLSPSRAKKHPSALVDNLASIIKYIDAAISSGEKLHELRKIHSHHSGIDVMSKTYTENVNSAVKEFRKCQL